jgi:hypothetical protein
MGDRVDLEGRSIRLKETDTKTDEQHGILTEPSVGWCGCARGFKDTGHETMAVFKRYNSIDKDGLAAEQRQTDTFMGARQVALRENPSEAIEK